ncbi:MAG: choice-of-anchor R domain-containing protein, partial [Patescibacteria group bacterium]
IGGNGANVTGNLTVATSVIEDVQARSTVCNQDQIVGQTNPQIDFAQSFIASDSLPLYKISINIKKIGSPSSPTVRIVNDNSSLPGTNSLASASLSSSLVTSSYGWVDVTFSSPANLVNGQTYWIVLDTSQDNSKYYIWCKDSNNGFGNGVAKYRQVWNSGSAWSSTITGDLTFKTYIGGGPGVIDNVDVLGDARSNTITNSTVTGTAYCQTGSGNNKVCDTSQPDPSIANMPISQGNIDQWESDAEAGGVITGNCGDGGVAGCNFSSGNTISLGPKKIVGNLSMDNGKHLIVTGVLHFTGNINISNNSDIKCDVSFGAGSCIIIADGWIDTGNNTTFSGSGQSGSYIMALSTIEGCNGGTQQPQCGEDNAGIILENNVTGAIFYTTKSMIILENNTNVKEIIGYKVELEQNSFIRYETGLMNANFISGPSGGWNIKSWKEVE